MKLTGKQVSTLLSSQRTALGWLSASVLVTGLFDPPETARALGWVMLAVGLFVYGSTAVLFLFTNQSKTKAKEGKNFSATSSDDEPVKSDDTSDTFKTCAWWLLLVQSLVIMLLLMHVGVAGVHAKGSD